MRKKRKKTGFYPQEKKRKKKQESFVSFRFFGNFKTLGHFMWRKRIALLLFCVKNERNDDGLCWQVAMHAGALSPITAAPQLYSTVHRQLHIGFCYRAGFQNEVEINMNLLTWMFDSEVTVLARPRCPRRSADSNMLNRALNLTLSYQIVDQTFHFNSPIWQQSGLCIN